MEIITSIDGTTHISYLDGAPPTVNVDLVALEARLMSHINGLYSQVAIADMIANYASAMADENSRRLTIASTVVNTNK